MTLSFEEKTQAKPQRSRIPFQRRIQDFKIEGAQKMSIAHHERKARNHFHSGGVHIGLS